MKKKKSIYIAYTGGTIGMKSTPQGYVPAVGYLLDQLTTLTELQHEDMPQYVLHEYENLIDSANITVKDWNTIATDIANRYHDYDGFLILHGTDTMAYTASALSFMLENLAKPVIVTGSQVPFSEIRNDARANLISALLLVTHHSIPGVNLYFNNKLFKGNRVRKIHTGGFDAFDSPNFAPLAILGIDIQLQKELLKKKQLAPFKLYLMKEQMIISLRLFPGISAKAIKHILKLPLRALILETYGAGNTPDKNVELINALRKANERGVILVNCTQCFQGAVNMDNYATGNMLQQAGVISGYDMTPEAILAKLNFLLSQDLSIDEVKHLLQVNLRGELTPGSNTTVSNS